MLTASVQHVYYLASVAIMYIAVAWICSFIRVDNWMGMGGWVGWSSGLALCEDHHIPLLQTFHHLHVLLVHG